MKYIANAFSLQMLKNENGSINYETISMDEFNNIKNDAVSFVGHEDTANVLGVEFHRENLSLDIGDVLYIAQLIGGRLPEGSTTLPDGFSFKFFRIVIS